MIVLLTLIDSVLDDKRSALAFDLPIGNLEHLSISLNLFLCIVLEYVYVDFHRSCRASSSLFGSFESVINDATKIWVFFWAIWCIKNACA